AEHVIKRIEVAIKLESCAQVLGRTLQLADNLRQSGLKIPLDRLDIRQGLFLRTRIHLPLLNSQLAEIGLGRFGSLLQRSDDPIQLATGSIGNRSTRGLTLRDERKPATEQGNENWWTNECQDHCVKVTLAFRIQSVL